jgi:hypothetical protein
MSLDVQNPLWVSSLVVATLWLMHQTYPCLGAVCDEDQQNIVFPNRSDSAGEQ